MGRSGIEEIRPRVIEKATGVVLEIGAGAGHNLPLYGHATKIFALEPSRELQEIAKKRSVKVPVEFIVASAEHIPLANHSVDTVVSTWTLCSVTNPKVVLSEIRRVLRPGGLFVFADHGRSPNTFVRAVQHIFTPITKVFTGNCHLNRNIEALVKEAGFTIQMIEYSRERFKPLMYNYLGVAR